MPAYYFSGFIPAPSPVKALALTMALILPAFPSCSPSPKAGGGIGGTGSVSASSVSSGTVSKLSNVTVSGLEYDTSNALYCIDDEPCSTESNLKLGMVVLVKGTVQSPSQESGSRIADTIAFEGAVEGVVQSVAPDESSLVVLGQFVAVNTNTVIDEGIPGRTLRNLRPGLDVIEVSGLVAGEGHILATFIMKRTGTPRYEVQGIIKNHDAGGKRFEIGQLVVEYSSAEVDDVAAGDTMNWNNRLVHVRGEEAQPRSEVPYGATLRATRVKPLGLTVEDSAEAKIEGFITHITQLGDVAVNNHPIQVSSATVFEGGTANEFVLGKHVSIHGTLEQGVLDAHVVMFREDLLIESNVELIDLQSRNLTLAGFPGVSIKTDISTLIEDGNTVSRFEDIRVGDHLKIYGKLLDGRQAVATDIERTGPSAAIVLQAPLQSAVDPQMILANVNIDTSGLSDSEFVGSYGSIGRRAFFEKAVIGRPVWGKGMLRGGIVTWSSVGING